MGRPGREIVTQLLPDLRKEYGVDLVIAQSENVSHGKSMTPHHMDELIKAGVDFFTGGNHSYNRENIHDRLNDPSSPVIAPANIVNEDHPGKGYKTIVTPKGVVLVISLLGSVFPEDLKVYSPLKRIDEILEEFKNKKLAGIVVNIHTDYSSEKVIMGHYLDGRVSVVVGDHWHIPTADSRILPGGTAHMTDVGMCGTLNSSLGIEYDSMIPRWRDDEIVKRNMSVMRPYQLNGLLVTDATENGAISCTHIRKII
jgi:metallophosphoesterase (TIGR00282 family)